MFFSFLKSELFRVSKMLSTYILPIVMVIVVLINGVMLLKLDLFSVLGMDRAQYDALLEEGNSVEGISESFQMGFEAGLDASQDMAEEEITYEVPSLWGEGIFYYDDVETLFQQSVATLTAILLMAIFTGIYIGDNYRYKYDKNIVIACKKRNLMTVVRIIVVAIYTLFIHVVTWLSTVLSAALMADSVKINPDKSAILYFIITYLLTFAFALVVMLITNLMRSKAAGISIGVILASGMLTMVVSLATIVAKHYLPLPDDFSFANYFLSQNLTVLGLQSEGAIVLRALLCAIIYSVISSLGSLFIIKKRDFV